VDLATVSARMGHSSVRTTADIYSHAIRGKDREVAEMWDKIMQPTREASKSKAVNWGSSFSGQSPRVPMNWQERWVATHFYEMAVTGQLATINYVDRVYAR